MHAFRRLFLSTSQPLNPSTSPRLVFSLVEVALALAITAFCLVAVFGLLPVGLNSNQASTEQTAAANIARSIIAVPAQHTFSQHQQFNLQY